MKTKLIYGLLLVVLGLGNSCSKQYDTIEYDFLSEVKCGEKDKAQYSSLNEIDVNHKKKMDDIIWNQIKKRQSLGLELDEDQKSFIKEQKSLLEKKSADEQKEKSKPKTLPLKPQEGASPIHTPTSPIEYDSGFSTLNTSSDPIPEQSRFVMPETYDLVALQTLRSEILMKCGVNSMEYQKVQKRINDLFVKH